MKRICRLDAGGGPACYETERGHMEETKLAERKAMLTALFRDPAYVPMKAKEIAALLNIPKGQREELQEVLDILVAKENTENRRASLSTGSSQDIPEASALSRWRGWNRMSSFQRKRPEAH